MIKCVLCIIGTWLLSDSVYSITLYMNSNSYQGERQTWKKDHWVRVIRAVLAIAVIYIGIVI